MSDLLLKDKVAVITGGTRGIGFCVAEKYLQNGAKVVIFGSKKQTIDTALAKLKTTFPNSQIEGLYPDITDFDQVKNAIDWVKEKFGKIDILVNNAGISASQSIFDYTPQDFEKIMAINVNAVFYNIKAVVQYMKEQGSGCIINTSSMVSLYAQRSGCGYPTSKFAVNGLTKALARELGPYQIRVNAVAPGVTRTDMVAALPEQIVKGISATIPLGRVGEPEEVADAFVFLASDNASYVSGEILSVDASTLV